MKVVTFTHPADPNPAPRLGAVLPDGRTLVDLQAAHFAMTARPVTVLRDEATFRAAGRLAEDLARRVVDWAASQRPPGTTVPLEDVRLAAPGDTG